MQQKPWVIKLMAFTLLLVPLTALSLALFSYFKMGVDVKTNIVMDLWLLAVASVIAAFGIWRVRPWGFFLFFLFTLAIVAVDLAHIIKDPGTFNFWDLVDASLAALGIIFILQKHVSAPYFNPKIRWWEQAKRHKVNLEAQLKAKDAPIKIQLLDISQTGCFIDSDSKFNPGDEALLSLAYNDFKFESPVRVIRTSDSPKGVGMIFLNTTRENTVEIKRIIKELKKNLKEAKPA